MTAFKDARAARRVNTTPSSQDGEKSGNFHGLPTAFLGNGLVRLEYLTTAGPRIVGLSYKGSPNLLADIHDMFWDTPYGKYYPLGGHRLWIAPESKARSYIPDGSGLQVRPNARGVELIGAVEIGSGVQKSLQIEIEEDRPVIHLLYTVTNKTASPITLAPWTISMFSLGGVAILPQPEGNVDPDGLLSNRILVLWPYTRFDDPRLRLADDFIAVRALSGLPPFKIGGFNSHGWIAYWRKGILFVKRFEPQPGEAFPDRGCNAEIYCNERGIELESLGPLVQLEVEQSCRFVEQWEFYDSLKQPFLRDWESRILSLEP